MKLLYAMSGSGELSVLSHVSRLILSLKLDILLSLKSRLCDTLGVIVFRCDVIWNTGKWSEMSVTKIPVAVLVLVEFVIMLSIRVAVL